MPRVLFRAAAWRRGVMLSFRLRHRLSRLLRLLFFFFFFSLSRRDYERSHACLRPYRQFMSYHTASGAMLIRSSVNS